MKKGKGKGGIRKKHKGSIKSTAGKYFDTRYVRETDDKNRTHVTRVHMEIPKIDRLDKKESINNFREAFDNPDKIINERPKAEVHCINKARKAKGLEEISTPESVMDRRKVEYIINSEAMVYSRWAARSLSCREKTELSYYSKVQYRKERALEYSATAHKLGPPKPKLPQAKPANGYSFATKPRKVAEVTQCNQASNDEHVVPSIAEVQWHINNSLPSDWPQHIAKYTNYIDSGYVVAKNKILRDSGMSNDMAFEELERDYAKALARIHELESGDSQVNGSGREYRLEKQVEELKEEKYLLEQELNFAHWEIAVTRDGEDASNQVKTPLDIKQLATLFTVFKSQCEYDILDAFGRVNGLSKEKRAELRGHFDKEAMSRLKASDNWQQYLAKQAAKDCYNERREHMKHIASEVFALNRIGLPDGQPPVSKALTLAKERLVYKRWGNRNTTPLCTRRMNYYQWWMDNITPTECSNRALMSTKMYKVLKKGKDLFEFANNYELLPWKRKQQEEEARKKQANAVKRKKKLIKQSVKQKEEGSKIKRELERQADIVKDKPAGSIRPEIAARRNAYLAKMYAENEAEKKRLG